MSDVYHYEIDDIFDLGKTEGLAIGEERGESRKANEIARKMRAANMPSTVIREMTGLTDAEIQAL